MAREDSISKKASKGDQDVLSKAHELLVKPLGTAFESQRKKLKKQVRAERGRGGDTKSAPEWRKALANGAWHELVRRLHPLWTYIVNFYKKAWDIESWMSDLKEDAPFQQLAQNFSEIPQDLLRAVADENQDSREREALALALEHARRELGLPPRDSETMRGYYNNPTKPKKPKKPTA